MASASLYHPLGLLAELTHRCPLGCPYCSNPLQLDLRADELDTATWARIFLEASDLGVLQVHLSGGEPAARRDLLAITAAAHDAGRYCNLITSAVGLKPSTLAALAEAGLDHVQVSIQDSDAVSSDHIAGYRSHPRASPGRCWPGVTAIECLRSRQREKRLSDGRMSCVRAFHELQGVMTTLMRNGRDRRSDSGHASKERVVLIGTDQRITSGPAARTAVL
jgi:hypothetical protein